MMTPFDLYSDQRAEKKGQQKRKQQWILLVFLLASTQKRDEFRYGYWTELQLPYKQK